jgi:carboxyvinyl-carboxyphosphonate phosphorylmutase
MNQSEQRALLRAILNGSQCLSPASVFDPISARVAESVGYKLGMVGGSSVAGAMLAGPDLLLITLSEFAEQIRKITRVSKLCLIADADHGYGNALNVMRTVQELEYAGVSALTIEDTALPRQFGQVAGEDRLICTEEAVGKLRAAVAARGDPSLIIVGRTCLLKGASIASVVERVQAYSKTGVDAIFVMGFEKREHVEAVHAATALPIIAGSSAAVRGLLKPEDLAALGVRILLQGHQPLSAVVKALEDVYRHLFSGGAPADLKGKIASAREMDDLMNAESYKLWQKEFLR